MGKNLLKQGLDFLRSSSKQIQKNYDAAAARALHLTVISGFVNIFLGLVKILSGILSLSVFVCVNGGYTLGMVAARYCALAGVLRAKDMREQYRYYRRAGIILIIASLLYIIYSGWSYFHPKYTAYHMYVALAIATFTFVEIGWNIQGVVANRKNKTPLLHAIKTINLAASLISLVLTQSAILSFSQGGYHDPSVNALLGGVMGTCAALLGVFMLWRIKRIEAKNQQEHGGPAE